MIDLINYLMEQLGESLDEAYCNAAAMLEDDEEEE